MSSPVPEFNFARPVSRRPINLGVNNNNNNNNNDFHSPLRYSDTDFRNTSSPHIKKELDRLQVYGLDIPADDTEAENLLNDEKSAFYASNKPRKLKNRHLLPYKTETIRDQYKYLSHIITHIYIAIKSLDLKGNLTISIEDLEAAKEIILNNKDVDTYIKSASSMNIDGQKFETLHSHENEGNSDDDDDSDYYESSDEEDEDAANSTPILKVEPESASIISLTYWTKELKNLLKMGLILPLGISCKLIKVFYSISLCRGQNIDITFYTQAISLLMREKKLLYDYGLRLDWKPVYAEFAYTLGNPTTFGPSMKDTRMKKLIAFALTTKRFFEEDSVPVLMEEIISKFSPHTVSSTLIHMTIMVPIHFEKPTLLEDGTVVYNKKDIRHYLPILFNLWLNNKSDKEINCLVTMIMNITSENLKQAASNESFIQCGPYGIFSKEQFKFLMNQLFLSSQLRHKDNRMIKYCKSIAQMIIHSLSSKYAFQTEGIIDFLKTFTDAISTMIHPSNMGPWSNILSEVVKKIAYSLHMRVQGEKIDRNLIPLYHPNYSTLPSSIKLNDEIVESVVKTLLPLIHLGSQSKSSSHRRHYTEALQVLCYMKPNLVLDNLLLDWYSSFESVNSTHRIPIVINQLTNLVRFIVELPVYRVHIPRLMSMLIPAIDSNDPHKTILTTDFVSIISAVIPIADLTEGSGDGGLIATDFTTQHLAYLEAKFYSSAPTNSQYGKEEISETFNYDPEFELSALYSGTSSFKEFLVQFCDRCFKFLELAPAIESGNTIESQTCALISYCFESLIDCTSEELYYVIADKFFEYVSNNVRHEVAIVFCNIAEAIVRRKPKEQLKKLMEFFMPHIESEINDDAGISRSQDVLSKDQRLIWNMRILSGAISGSGTAILPYLPSLEKFIILKTYKLRGTAALCAAMLISCTFSTLSYTKPLERQLISPKWLEEHNGKYTEECWGAFQFSKDRFNKKYLDFEWYIPSSTEVNAISEHFENLAQSSVGYINSVIPTLNKTSKLQLDDIDQIGFHVELLEGLLKGVCSLFDQSYKEPAVNKSLGKLKPSVSSVSMGSTVSLNTLTKSESVSPINETNIKNSIESQENTEKKKDEDMMVVDEEPSINPINSEIEIKIEKTESSSNLSIFSGEFPSELPTRAVTPISDSIDAVNPTLTKRADILYNYGPYFTKDPFLNAMDSSYKKLHATREAIGECLHELVKSLITRGGSIELTGKAIQCISTWLNDCGYYSMDNELYTDNLHFISILDFPGVFSPYTRTVFGSRLTVYHCSRINISCCSRLPTKLDKVLIKDLVSLSASPYGITATHSASILGTSLNRIMNCTSVIFNIFKDWENAILNKEKEILINIMIMFDKKRLRGLVEKSPVAFPKYEELLFKSAELNLEEVTVMSMKLFKSIKKFVKIPAKVCIFDEEIVECIRPPDNDIDFKISALKLAKQKKKANIFMQLSNIVNKSLSRLSNKLNWKFMLLVMELITTIQSHLEVPLEKNVLSTLLKYVDGSHPEVSKKGMFWIASIMDTVESRSFSNYDMNKLIGIGLSDDNIVPFKEIIPENSPKSFFEEMKNIDNPKFFIDNKQWIPIKAWNKNLKVVKPSHRTSYNFNEEDDIAVKQFASNINKEWLLTLLKTHIDESEATSAFFPGIVYFFSSICTLILFGYIETMKLEDLFEIADSIYKGDERPTHVAVSEIYCGVLFACKHNPDSMKIADKEISKRIQSIIDNDLTQSTFKMWSIFSWWLSSHFDIRRTPKILSLLCDFKVDKDTKKSPFSLKCRLTFLSSYMDSETNRFHKFEDVSNQLFTILAHPYDIISKEVSSILFDTLFYNDTENVLLFDDFISESHKDESGLGVIPNVRNEIFHKNLKEFFIETLELAKSNKGKTAQEIANSDFMYHVKGLNALLLRMLKTAFNVEVVDYIIPYILPLVTELDKIKDACKLAEISVDAIFLMLASTRYNKEQSVDIINLLKNNLGWETPNLTQYKHILAFFGIYGTIRFLERTPEQRKELMEIVCSMLSNQHLYVREQFSYNIKIFVHLFLDSEREEVIKSCIKRFKKIIKKNKPNKNVKLTNEQMNMVHGATLGLCALVEAYPYSTPPPKWLPDVLSLLEVKCTSYNGIISRAAKDTLSQFKKTRQDTWHIDSKFFTEEQLEDLEGVLYKSYYL